MAKFIKLCLNKFSFMWEEESIGRKQWLVGANMNSNLLFFYFYSTCIGQNLLKHYYRIPLLIFWLFKLKQFFLEYYHSPYSEKLCIHSNVSVERFFKKSGSKVYIRKLPLHTVYNSCQNNINNNQAYSIAF